jgi:acyl-CoA thioester hydrolase
MTNYQQKIQLRWSDLDPNFHLRHSVYYDFGASMRMAFLTENGITPAVMQANKIGPILFREECVFKREIQFSDLVEINVQLIKSTPEMGRWSITHQIWKNGDTLSAILTVDGAWIDTNLRKLTLPPPEFKEAFEKMPRADNFEWVIR